MKGISIIIPTEKDRLKMLVDTLMCYTDKLMDFRLIEVIVPSRTIMDSKEIFDYFNKYCQDYIDEGISMDATIPLNIKVIPYTYDGEYFNPSMALNLGVKNSSYNNILITCPEVVPRTNVLEQLQDLEEGNYICQVIDGNEDSTDGISLVNKNFRGETPAMYFLALFRKEDLEKINGWDEDFMGGYAWEDTDFGNRWIRAGIPFEVRDEIIGVHRYHPRGSTNPGWDRNANLCVQNTINNIIRPKNGLVKE
jgi:hypothetical protein